MSPTIYGNVAHGAGAGATHVPFPEPTASDVDPWERLERARARRATRSPITLGPAKSPPPVPAPEPARKPRPAPRPQKRKARAPKPRPEHVDDASQRVQQQRTTTQSAENLQVSPRPVRAATKAAGAAPKRTPRAGRTATWDLQRAKDLAAGGASITEIADEVHARPDTVRRGLKRAGIPVKDARRDASSRGGRRTPEAVCRAVVTLYSGPEQLSVPAIAERTDLGVRTVRQILRRAEVPMRDDRKRFSGRAHPVSKRLRELDPEHVAQLYEEHGSVAGLAQALEIGHSTAGRLLAHLGIQARPSAEVQRGRPGVDGGAHALAMEILAAGETPARVRRWALANGMAPAQRGLPSRAIWSAYQGRESRGIGA